MPTVIFTAGLSPLARGTQIRLYVALFGARFIPAGAGNTLKKINVGYSFTVYPRWCGEH
ncbi:hypothetical protein STBHUCCB_29870 [Salmonella enterica subsp. enterica serovar Typhi str. P-stx-12]|nr:hypothetical protein STBHUCCB_29870 [Salmonella enterica subsp. enterica serovar Typhi str. P-stx-12]AXR54854.1 hypothetical protein CJP42_4068 [Salmonella enterica subsp. enterica serovar Typhi]